jgi:predicted flap endonuclease-1-like 5' DNA nuclease
MRNSKGKHSHGKRRWFVSDPNLRRSSVAAVREPEFMNRLRLTLLLILGSSFIPAIASAQGRFFRRRPRQTEQVQPKSQYQRNWAPAPRQPSKPAPVVETRSQAATLAKRTGSQAKTTDVPVVTPAIEPNIPYVEAPGEKVPMDSRWVRAKSEPVDALLNLESYADLMSQFEDRRDPKDIKAPELKPWPVVTPQPAGLPKQATAGVPRLENTDLAATRDDLGNPLRNNPLGYNPLVDLYDQTVNASLSLTPLDLDYANNNLVFDDLNELNRSEQESKWGAPIWVEPLNELLDEQVVQNRPTNPSVESQISEALSLDAVTSAFDVAEKRSPTTDAVMLLASTKQLKESSAISEPDVIAAVVRPSRSAVVDSRVLANWSMIPLLVLPLYYFGRTKRRGKQQRQMQESRAEAMATNDAQNKRLAAVRNGGTRAGKRRVAPLAQAVDEEASQLEPGAPAASAVAQATSHEYVANSNEHYEDYSDEYYSPADEALLSASYDTGMQWDERDDFSFIPGLSASMLETFHSCGINHPVDLATAERSTLEELQRRLGGQFTIKQIAQWCELSRNQLANNNSRVLQVSEDDFEQQAMDDIAAMQSLTSAVYAHDDLTLIDGIDDGMQRLLNQFGVYRFSEMATAERSNLNRIVESDPTNSLTIEKLINYCQIAKQHLPAMAFNVQNANRLEIREQDFYDAVQTEFAE